MRILLIGFGSRGDVQPLLAIGQGLQAVGYDVRLATGVNFQAMVEDAGLAFAPIHTDMQALMSGASGQEWIENSSNSLLKEAQNMRRMLADAGPAPAYDLLEASQTADVLVSGLSSLGIADAIAQKTGKQHILVLFAPLTPTASPAATMVPAVPFAFPLNRLAGRAGQYFTYYIFRDAINHFRRELGLPPQSYGDYARRLNRDVPIVHPISPRVMPRPADWPAHIAVTGYWFYDAPSAWRPAPALEAFLKAGEPPVYIGFGSMSNKNPEATTRIMIEALQQAGRRGIIHSGWAGLRADNLPDDVFLLDFAPHDWLFPRMSAVIHHGGAGTTAAALRAGVPSSVVSHMGDQPYWGNRVHALGVGGPLIRRHQLSVERLSAVIRQITTDEALRQRAQALGVAIRQEDGVASAVRRISAIAGGPMPS